MSVDVAVQPLELFSGDFLYLAIVFLALALLAAIVDPNGDSDRDGERGFQEFDRSRTYRRVTMTRFE